MKRETRMASGTAAVALGVLASVAGLRITSAECKSDGCRCATCGTEHCIVVPDAKTTKRWVYATKLVPYCRTKCPNPLKCRHDSCDTCPSCEECVRYKRVLVKREVVTTTPGYKCIPACEACRAKNAGVPSRDPRKPSSGAPIAQPGEPQLLPPPPGPSPVDSGP